MASSRAEGLTLRELREQLDDVLPVLAVMRGEQQLAAFRFRGVLRAGDALLVEGETREIEKLAHRAGLEIGLAEADEGTKGEADAPAGGRGAVSEPEPGGEAGAKAAG